MEKFDVIVVGLGCAGLSAAHFCSKMGLKVLGFEMNSSSGEVGTSSQGTTRIYRTINTNPAKQEIMKTSIAMWKEAEAELRELKQTQIEFATIETELLTPCEYLIFGEQDSPNIKAMLENGKDRNWISGEEIMQKFPRFCNVPNDYVGCVTDDAGIIRVKHAINGYRILSQQMGAELRYKQKVEEVYKDHVKLANGDIYYSNHVVVC